MSSWQRLRAFTKARIGLGAVGASLPTRHHLEILKSQALARDALWRPWPHDTLAEVLRSLGQVSVTLKTQVSDRQTYLARPDWGRLLSDAARAQLAAPAAFGRQPWDRRVVFCITDGLSAEAVVQHMEPFLRVFLPRLRRETFARSKPFPFVLLPFARVAAADQVGEILGSDLTVMFVGERPGLSAHDSLGIYLTYGPKTGKLDGLRNCISNIRPPDGLSYETASAQLCYLMRESLSRRLSGVDLKMESDILIGADSSSPLMRDDKKS